MGRKANKTGQAWEDQIVACAYRHCSEVALERIHNGARRVGPGGQKMVPLKQPYDFTGTLPGGIGLHFDAKASERASGLPASNPEYCKPHQLRALLAQARIGAVAGLLVRCDAMQDIRWLGIVHLYRPGYGVSDIRWDDSRWLVLGTFDPWRPRIPWLRLADPANRLITGT